MDAVTVADDETVDRIEQFVVKDYVHAELDPLTRFNDRDWFVRLVQQLDFQNLRAAVAMTISELGSIDVFSSRLRLFANELGLGISSFLRHDHFLITCSTSAGGPSASMR